MHSWFVTHLYKIILRINDNTFITSNKGSHVAIFNFNNFKGKITFLKMPSFLLGMLANSILNQLDLNGKGIATRSSAMDPSWQIAGDIRPAIRIICKRKPFIKK